MNKLLGIKQEALEDGIPIMHDDGISFLINLVKNNNFIYILEIGTGVGYSALALANSDKTILIDTIERDNERYTKACTNVVKLGLQNQVNLFCMDALLMNLNNLRKEYDLIFIDAAKAQSKNFFEYYKHLLSFNGYIIVDNIDFHGLTDSGIEIKNRNTRQLVGKIKQFKQFIFNQENYEVNYLKVGDGLIAIKRKGIK